MSIVLVGISHHQAPVELRERAALDRTRSAELAQALAGERSEAVCLSTCNRTELYLADESPDAAEEKAEAALLALESRLGPALYRLRDELTRRVNVAVTPNRINAVLFKEIIVQ